MAAIDSLLRTMLDKGGSDLHLTVGLPPKSRISGSLQAIGETPLTSQQMEALQSQGPQAQFKALADLAGFPAFAAMRGVPKAKTEACLADPAAATQLVQMNTDAVANFKIQGTPSFLINGELVPDTSTWELLEPKIKAALGG